MKKIIILVFFVVSLSACKMQDILSSSGGSAQDSVVSLTKKSIIVSHLNKKKSRQKKHGISITIEPITHVPTLFYRVRMDSEFNLFVMNGQRSYTETRTPFYQNSTGLAFRVKISNNSKRVFRPKNAVLTFSVDGESTSVDPTRYKKLANAIIVPNSSKTIIVFGPNVEHLEKSKGTAHLGMYDVATGNKLSNFEWYFKYKTKVKQVKNKVRRLSVKLTQYAASSRDGKIFKAE